MEELFGDPMDPEVIASMGDAGWDDEDDYDDYDETAALLDVALSGQGHVGDIEIGDVEIGARRINPRWARRRGRRYGKMARLARQNRELKMMLSRGVPMRRATPKARMVVPTTVRSGPWGNSLIVAAAGAATISVVAQDAFSISRIVISGYDPVAPAVVAPESILVTDIKVGTDSIFPNVGQFNASLFQPDSTGRGIVRARTVQPGTTLSCQLVVPIAGTYSFMGASELAK